MSDEQTIINLTDYYYKKTEIDNLLNNKFGINTQLPDNTRLYEVSTPGFYYAYNASGINDAPEDITTFFLLVESFATPIVNYKSKIFIRQILTKAGNNDTYIRGIVYRVDYPMNGGEPTISISERSWEKITLETTIAPPVS